MLLARSGARGLLVDRARFPSDSVNGHAIKPPGVAYLQRWGLLDAVLATGCPPIYQRELWIDGRPLPGPPLAADALPFVAPRRTVLDLTLVEAAAAAGVDVHEKTTAAALLRHEDQVSGIEVTSQSGQPLRAVAPVVIGADGKRSWGAQQVGAPFEHYLRPVTIAYDLLERLPCRRPRAPLCCRPCRWHFSDQ
jgi:2-polyprenyl-6-methoxyphenol hydroxylase-like FAD-dependent oxidoreductase